ncbi:hypothetical protein IAR55_004976 [Kwoniella newhampshirensis]|uniref:VWFA domain-containing protein n=1 Tax=Kwoniella newhampshirensis TaxID=1651941 RepID=A0AAW0YWK9_9TREE
MPWNPFKNKSKSTSSSSSVAASQQQQQQTYTPATYASAQHTNTISSSAGDGNGKQAYAPPPGPPPPSQSSGGRGMTAAPPSYGASIQVRDQAGEDPLEMLKMYDTVFLVDDSGSMAGSRWTQAMNALMGVADLVGKYDDDGFDVYFLNSRKDGSGMRTSRQVADLFGGVRPNGATPTGQRLEYLLRDYMKKLERSRTFSIGAGKGNIKPMNLIVITDGAPTDDPESVIVTFAKRLDKGEYPLSQVGIQFLQIGNDAQAKAALEEMDDGLSSTHDIRDIVDTVPYSGEDMSADIIIKTLLGGINRRLDRKK